MVSRDEILEIQQPSRSTRWIGPLLIVFGLVVAWGAIEELAGIAHEGRWGSAFAPLSLAGVALGALILGAQMVWLRGSVRIDLDQGTVTATGRSFRSRWDNRHRLGEFESVEVRPARGGFPWTTPEAWLVGPWTTLKLNRSGCFPPATIASADEEACDVRSMAAVVAESCGLTRVEV